MAGHSRWLETRLYEVLGAWVAVEPDPEVKSAFAAHSLRHAWHAEVWRERVPKVAHLDADALTVPAGEAVAGMVGALEEAAGADQTIERLVGVARLVLPRLVAAYRVRLEAAHPLADGPTVRWLGLVLADEGAALAEVDRLLQARLDGDGRPLVERAAAFQVALEPLLAGPPPLAEPLTGLPRPARHESM
ncbi:MAG TPA: hypothetical protein VHG90_01340 [Acidimicrobiales bacterium]|nr:hypothetical protein [Acidimicrobiales bacterium]